MGVVSTKPLRIDDNTSVQLDSSPPSLLSSFPFKGEKENSLELVVVHRPGVNSSNSHADDKLMYYMQPDGMSNLWREDGWWF
jgi:hypothetical protein